MKLDAFDAGSRLGDYEIVGRLRAGGMATLFLGRRHGAAGVSRPVAIKVIHPHLAEDEQIVRMFIDEARISAHISHKNVVSVENFGEHAGVYFIAMEYVDGVSVAQLLRATWKRYEQLPPELAVHVAMETAAGLHAAHETAGDDGEALHIVHRDVSPSNILMTRDGAIKVIDFGIAKARNRLGETRDGGSLKGKVRYMSPEQAWGRSLDRTADVYALGIVLWELLTCKQLFAGDDELEILERVRAPEIEPPSMYNPLVSPALDEVVLAATAKDPQQRIPTAQELRRRLLAAVPAAGAVSPERLSELVRTVRVTLGMEKPTEDDQPTTPATPMQVTTEAVLANPDSSVRAAGQVQVDESPSISITMARRPRRGWYIALGAAALAAVAVVGFVLVRPGSEPAAATRAMPETPSPKPVEPPQEPPPVEPPVEAVVTDNPDAGAAAVIAKPVVRAQNRPKPKPPAAVVKTGPKAVAADGTLLADDTAPSKKQPKSKVAKPKPKPRGEIKVDDTVLAQ